MDKYSIILSIPFGFVAKLRSNYWRCKIVSNLFLQEEDELARREISAEEIKSRQAELAKVKALMFYQQMKQHRINKIKSKAYRSIRKKQKLRRSVKITEILFIHNRFIIFLIN